MILPFGFSVTSKDSLEAGAKEHIREIHKNLKVAHEIANENTRNSGETSKIKRNL